MVGTLSPVPIAEAVAAALEDREFYERMQAYRLAPATYQARVLECFDDVKAHVVRLVRDLEEQANAGRAAEVDRIAALEARLAAVESKLAGGG